MEKQTYDKPDGEIYKIDNGKDWMIFWSDKTVQLYDSETAKTAFICPEEQLLRVLEERERIRNTVQQTINESLL
jgi:hypothetical protein